MNLDEVTRLILNKVTEETKRLNSYKNDIKKTENEKLLCLAIVTKGRYADVELVFDTESELKIFLTGLQVIIKEI